MQKENKNTAAKYKPVRPFDNDNSAVKQNKKCMKSLHV